MDSRGGFDGRKSRRRPRGTEAKPDTIAELFHADPAKAFVMKHIGQLVAGGLAAWDMLDNGEIELRFSTGETFILAERVIVRLV